MITLTSLLQKLSFGHLADLSLVGEGSGVVPEAHIPRLVIHINGAFTALHTRFPLRLRTAEVQVLSGKFLYPMRPEHSLLQGTVDEDHFIVDSEQDPFGDLLSIERVFDSAKTELGLNDRRDPTSWFTPEPDVLAMDYPVTGDSYFVEYRANRSIAQPVLYEATDGETMVYNTDAVQIPLLPALENALLLHIAAHVYCSKGGESGIQKYGQLLQAYEAECARLEGQNTLTTSISEDRAERIVAAGWV